MSNPQIVARVSEAHPGPELPDGWTHTTLSDVAELIFGQSPPSATYNTESAGLPFFQGKAEFGPLHPTPSKWCTAPTRIAEKGDILISVRAPVGPTNIANTQCAIGRGLAAIRPYISKGYVRFWLKRSEHELASKGTGTTFNAITKNVLKSHSIPVAPINEQHRITEKIETLFARIDKGEEALREVRKLLKRYRQSVLKAAVTGELTRDWREANKEKLEPVSELLARILETRRENWQGGAKYREPASPEIVGLHSLPEGWVWASVDHLLRSGLSNGRSVKTAENGFPVLRLTALNDGRIDLSERKIGDWTKEDAEAYWVQQGDILVSRGNGSKQLVGRGGLVEEKPDPVAFPDTMIRIPLNLFCVDAEWFVHLWNSPFMRAQIESSAKTTAGIYKINQGDIRSFTVPLPSLAEQREIAVLIDGLMARALQLEAVCQAELIRSNSLRQSILKSAFTGKLVPQDPNDEPASELLVRIHSEV